MPTPPSGPQRPGAPAPLVDGDLALLPAESEVGTYAFELVWEEAQVGRVELLVDEEDADVLWVVVPEYRAVGIAERALRLALDWAVDDLGVARVEARVPDVDRDSLRAAIRSGMRREGIARAARVGAGSRGDVVVLARVATDPPPDSREGFIGILNATLPTKRAIAQGVLRDRDGRVLLCELTYKDEWDLPGGVVDPSESPAHCVVREVREELGLDVEVRSLLAVNWLPPWRGWTDATVFVFELALDDADGIAGRATLQRREIRALHFADEEEWEGRVAAYNQRLLAFLATHTGPTAYLEDGLPAL
ncbi:NUDIX hydrolase [Phycicoccus sp. 3266]|uniref:NUDIX hydrolase n=1 Tax=Phycicoccus sp. 3266 TaxID=2817751 RepID=UPI00285588EB|nr:NUDIX hydrolase [Phycicoccus sp. 3266]MDR6863972.1 ADP-ribose pyrophosphatase YjhB (NUDIX family)/GNAT superfamily N-acetyltransferase [Phycicoccus sp. 3266]